MSFVIDRFEEKFAVIVAPSGEIYNIPKAILPEDAKEGCIVDIIVNHKDTDIKKQEVKRLLDSLFDETE